MSNTITQPHDQVAFFLRPASILVTGTPKGSGSTGPEPWQTMASAELKALAERIADRQGLCVYPETSLPDNVVTFPGSRVQP